MTIADFDGLRRQLRAELYFVGEVGISITKIRYICLDFAYFNALAKIF